MLIEVKKIPNGVRFFESEVIIDGKNVPIKLKTERDYANISCFAEYKTEIDCECSRCLEGFKQKIAGNVRFFIIPESELFNEEDFDCYFYRSENDKIDFEQTIFDDIWTQVPMKPLCKEECTGIIWGNSKKEAQSLTETKEENGQWEFALEKLKKVKR